jgi:shikimate kinase
MLNICINCGVYRADKVIEPQGPFAICPECGYRQAFRRLPLLIVSGASGVGKSTVCHRLLGQRDDVVLLDSDFLWRPEFDRPEDRYRDFFETWLRLCKNISQSGRPVVLFGAGIGVPENMEPCVERRYFSELCYLALTCAEDVLVERLQRRPEGSKSRELAYIETHVRFNRWFREHASQAQPAVELLDTTGLSIGKTTGMVAAWIGSKLEYHILPGGSDPVSSV